MPAKKSASKSKKVAASATKKSATKKAVVKKTTAKKSVSSKTRSSKSKSLPRVFGLLGLSAVAYIALIAVTFMFAESSYIDVTMPYQVADPLNGGGLVSASRIIYSLDLRWIIVALAATSLVLPLKNLIKRTDSDSSRVRWIEVAVASAVMLESLALISGWTDVVTIKLLWLVVILVGFIGYRQDKYVANNKQLSVGYSRAIQFAIAFVAVLFLATTLATYVFGMVSPAWASYGALLVVLLGLLAYGINYSKSLKVKSDVVNRNFWLITLSTRLSFAAVVIASLIK